MKSRNNRDWFGYLMNFVAVCLGIVITFAGQGLINRHAERNEVKLLSFSPRIFKKIS